MKSVCCPVVSAGLAGAFADECTDDVCLVQTNSAMETTQGESLSIESQVGIRQRNKARVKALIESLEQEKELVAEVLAETATEEETSKFTSFLQTVSKSLFQSKAAPEGPTKAELLTKLIQQGVNTAGMSKEAALAMVGAENKWVNRAAQSETSDGPSCPEGFTLWPLRDVNSTENDAADDAPDTDATAGGDTGADVVQVDREEAITGGGTDPTKYGEFDISGEYQANGSEADISETPEGGAGSLTGFTSGDIGITQAESEAVANQALEDIDARQGNGP